MLNACLLPTTMNLNIVAMGGGTGLSVLLHGLKFACFHGDTASADDRDKLMNGHTTTFLCDCDNYPVWIDIRNNILQPGKGSQHRVTKKRLIYTGFFRKHACY